MKRRYVIIAILAAALLSAKTIYAENIPKPDGWVNDYAGVVSVEDRGKITSIITELEQKTGAEIFVVTIKSMAPYDEQSYARIYFDSWKPGKKGKDNGVLVLLAIKERRWRIEAGYGIEGILPDGRCGQIGRDYMVPYFKNGEYGKGLYRGIAAMASVIADDAKITLNNAEVKNVSISTDSSPMPIELLLFVFIFIIPIAMSIARARYHRKGNKGYWTTGGFGGGGFGGGFGGGGFGGGGFGGGGGGGGGGARGGF